jgi:hypothetical protein
VSNLNFTNTPLQKLLNKRNIFSRVDALEAKDEAPSLTAESLGEITPDAGDIYVTEITNIITNEVVGLPEAPIDGTIYGRKDAAWFAAGGAAQQVSVLTSQFDKTSNTTLSEVTGLSIDVVAGNTYIFNAVLQTTDGGGGGKIAINGSCTSSMFIAGFSVFAAATSLGTVVANGNGLGCVIVEGSITVSASGTLYPEFAQNSSNASASSVLVGSFFKVELVV